ncbi:hypothetical protein ABLE92_25560 [Gordonia sp. VNQ95]|uniref:hypothetical protein n=1 Tax=Gordonia sp. VNQ95 TaxID=3156619 RepID=UPI0032B45F7C
MVTAADVVGGAVVVVDGVVVAGAAVVVVVVVVLVVTALSVHFWFVAPLQVRRETAPDAAVRQ